MRGHLTSDEIQRIIRLLRDTDLPLAAIAKRMSCTAGTIGAINRRYKIRFYDRKRSRCAKLPPA